MKIVADLCAAFVAGVFFASSYGKARNRAATELAFASWGLPTGKLQVAALVVEEFVVASVVIVWPNIGGYIALVFMAIFTFFIIRMLARGVRTVCPCFGSYSSELSQKSLVQNATVIAACCVAPVASRSGSAIGIRTVMSILVAVAILVLAKDETQRTNEIDIRG